MATDTEFVLSTLKVKNLKTYEIDFSHFEVEVWSSTTPRVSGGALSNLKYSGNLAGTRRGFVVVSQDMVIDNLVKGLYYIVRYRVVTNDQRYSDWYQEEQRIDDSSISVTINNKSVIAQNGVIKASFNIVNVPSDYACVYWYVRDTETTIKQDVIPDYITNHLDRSGSDGVASLDVPAKSNKYIYAFVTDFSRNKHSSSAESIGSVAAVTAPVIDANNVSYGNKRFKVAFAYNFTNNPDTTEFQFSIKRIDGGNYEIFQVVRPEGTGSLNVILEVPAVYVAADNECYFSVKITAKNSIGMVSAESSEIVKPAPTPSTSFSSNTLTYEKKIIKLKFNYNYAGANNGDVQLFRLKVAETVSQKTWYQDIPIDQARGVAFDHQIDWALQGGETYACSLYALDSMGIISDAFNAGQIVAPYPESVIDENAMLFLYDTGFGSTDGLYPADVPSFCIRTDGRYGGAVECVESPSNILDYASQPNIMTKESFENNKPYAYGYYFGSAGNKLVHAGVTFDDESKYSIAHTIIWNGSTNGDTHYDGKDTTYSLLLRHGSNNRFAFKADGNYTDWSSNSSNGIVGKLASVIFAFSYGQAGVWLNNSLVDNEYKSISNGVGTTYQNFGYPNNSDGFAGYLCRRLIFNLDLGDEAYKVLRGLVATGAPIPFEYTGASMIDQTEGILVVGKRYRIEQFESGDDFVNCGAINETGNEFTATYPEPTTWLNGSSLLRIGCVLQMEPWSAFDNYWLDVSGNGYICTPTEATAAQYTPTFRNSGFILGGNSLVAPTEPLVWYGDYDNYICNNLITNPEFEDDVSGWVESGCALARVGGGRNGGYCLQITPDTGAFAYQDISGLNIGDVLWLEGYVKSGTSTNAIGKISLYSGAGTALLGSAQIGVSTSWQYLRLSGSLSHTTARVKLEKASGESGTILFDSIKLYKSSASDYLLSIWDKIPYSKYGYLSIEGREVVSGTATGTQSNGHLKDSTQAFSYPVQNYDIVHNKTTGKGFVVTNVATGDLTLNYAGACFSTGDEYEIITRRGSGLLATTMLSGDGKWNESFLGVRTNKNDNRFYVTFQKNPVDSTNHMYLDYLHCLKSMEDGMVGCWNLGENAKYDTDKTADSTYYANHGVMNGGLAYVSDHNFVANMAMSFDGSTAFISNLGNCPAGAFSVSAWVKFNTAATWQAIYSASHETWLGYNSGTTLLRLYCGGSGDYADATISLHGAWHHVVVLWNGSAVKIYVDGVQQSLSITGTPNNPLATAAQIGKRSTGLHEYLKASLCKVKLYNRALSEAEIIRQYLQYKTTNPSFSMKNTADAPYLFDRMLYDTQYKKTYVHKDMCTQLTPDFDPQLRMLRYDTANLLNTSAFLITFDIKFLTLTQKTGWIIYHQYNSSNYCHIYQKEDGSIYLRLGSGSAIDTGFDVVTDKWYRMTLKLDSGDYYFYSTDGDNDKIALKKSGTYSGLTALATHLIVGASEIIDIDNVNPECLLCNLRIDKVTKTNEQIVAYSELIEPFFDPNPNSVPAQVVQFTSSDNIYAVDSKRYLKPRGRVNITNGSTTITGDKIDVLSKIFSPGEIIELEKTSAGSVRYVINTVSDYSLTVTQAIAESSAKGIPFNNFTWKDIAEIVEPLREFKIVKQYVS